VIIVLGALILKCKFNRNDTALTMQTEEVIRLTNKAKDKIHALKAAQHNPQAKLRIYIVGGGCSGFQYKFLIESDCKSSDHVFDEVVIDPLSIHYLMGAEIDYVENLSGSQFVVNNPNAQTTCGCGASFSID